MTCQEVRESIADYLTGQLSAAALDKFNSHIEGCDACRGELEYLESMWASLGKMPEVEPGPDLRARFYTMLEDEKRRVARATRRSWLTRADEWLGSWWPRRPAVQLAMSAVVLVVGLTVGLRFETGAQRNGEIAQLRGEVQQMYQMVSLSLIDQRSSSERLRGVNWSTRVAEPSEALLTSLTNTLDSDPNVNVRIAAVDALSLFRGEPGVVDALTQALSRESSPMVQIALIDLLTVMQERKALEALRQFIEMQNVMPSVKDHAKSKMSEFM